MTENKDNELEFQRIKLLDNMAAAMWQEEAMRATGRPRLVRWTEAGEQERTRWRGIAAAGMASLAKWIAL